MNEDEELYNSLKNDFYEMLKFVPIEVSSVLKESFENKSNDYVGIKKKIIDNILDSYNEGKFTKEQMTAWIEICTLAVENTEQDFEQFMKNRKKEKE